MSQWTFIDEKSKRVIGVCEMFHIVKLKVGVEKMKWARECSNKTRRSLRVATQRLRKKSLLRNFFSQVRGLVCVTLPIVRESVSRVHFYLLQKRKVTELDCGMIAQNETLEINPFSRSWVILSDSLLGMTLWPRAATSPCFAKRSKECVCPGFEAVRASSTGTYFSDDLKIKSVTRDGN